MFQWKERRGAERRNFSGCEKSIWAPEEVEVSTDREGGGAQTLSLPRPGHAEGDRSGQWSDKRRRK